MDNKSVRNESKKSLIKPRKRKETRKVEIGWLCSDSNTKILRQVRTKFGGGTRRVSVDRNMKCKEILEKAKQLFFPGGNSSKGNLNNFNIELFDYEHHKCELDLTVYEMYEISSLTSLRFYLATYYKIGVASQNNDDDFFIPATVTSEENQYEQPSLSVENYRPYTRTQSNSALTNLLENFDENVLDDNSFSAAELFPDASLSDNIIYEVTEFPNEEILRNKKLVFHRGQIFYEFIEAVKNHDVNFDNINIEIILPNGIPEVAEDFGGVFRDALSEFWTTFYENCTEGTDYKVPIIRHDFGRTEWEAVAKILVGGYRKEKYFPIRIAPAFFKQCFKEVVNKTELVNNFMHYLSEMDKNIINTALNDFENVDQEDLLNLCSSFKAKWLPTKENIQELVEEIAEQEMLQRSAFIIQSFSPELLSISKIIDLEDLYKKLSPTVKNVVACFVGSDNMSEVDKQIFGFLLKYIKESDEKVRCALLRLCTGSNLANHKIKVEMIDLNGFGRAPIAHTCSKLLQLPNSYKTFIEFRSELNSLFISDVWVMDIV